MGAALLGSFAGALGLYYASVRLESRRRKALSEIRRKAKVYTPIREELVALRRVIAEDRHLSEGIRRERPDRQWMRNAPLLVIWREFVDDGRANTTASPRVREALGRVEDATDAFNAALEEAHNIFRERGDVIAEQSGFTPDFHGWQQREFRTLLRDGVRDARIYHEYVSPSDPHKDVSPLMSAPATLTAEQTAFITQWEGDRAVRDATKKLTEAESGLGDTANEAIAELDAAMKRIADDYEHEPD